ncbi:FecR domain-containing protein [Undibacterium sp. TS12]|uniref:FecR domain-containing protein n=1 Tax=Undibacterium sp. TS12 TaxID=2908202 RepID=UPI001F4CFB80|nr:FecR domain-containing protein [Undibacterium sp. TS12]MCH8622884.1 FecR domain-containing protein [Undibacterium sp. TS12]
MRLTRPLLLRQISPPLPRLLLSSLIRSPLLCLALIAVATPSSISAAPVTAAMQIPGSFISTPPDMTYFALQGDTLSSIAKRYTERTQNWQIIGKRNKISNDRAIPIGTPILIPLDLLPEEASEARVIAMTGNPAYKAVDGSSGNLALGSIVKEGTQISTDKNGFLTLALPDETRISIPSNSDVSLAKLRKTRYTGSPRTEVSLLQGKVESRVSPLSNNKGRYEVRTNLAVAGVRGTNFRVGVNTDGVANEVLEGGVAVNSAEGKKSDELILPAGKGNVVSTSGVGKPIDLLTPPVMNDSFLLQERPTLLFQVEDRPEAVGYRVQIARDKEVLDVLAENRYKENRFKFDGFADGNYFVRITAIDKLGLEGLPMIKAFKMKARPEPPFTVQPKNKVRAESLNFAWTEASNAIAYHLQVASDAGFRNLLIDKTDLKEAQFGAGRPKEGDYYWRVATIAPTNGQTDHGPYSDVQKFTVLPVTSMAPPDDAGNLLSLSWSSEPGQTFLIQVSTDAEFRKIYLSKELDKAELKIKRPDAGVYFIRVRSTDPDGYVSAFTSTQKITLLPRWTSSDGSVIQSGSGPVGTNY